MKMKKYISGLLMLLPVLFAGNAFAQQDPQFTQYMFNPLYINPAYAGSRGVMNGVVDLRQQWVGFEGAPNTQVLSVNTPGKKGKVGFGLEVIADEIGPKRNTGAYLDYAYRFPVGKGKLAFGLGAGIMNYRINWSLVEYKDQADVYNQLGSTNLTKPDFKFGMYFNNKHFYWGLSYTHLNQEVYTVTTDSLEFSAHMNSHAFFTIGRAFQITDNVIFSPSIMARGIVGTNSGDVDLNLNFCYKDVLWIGCGFRSEHSVLLMTEYSITNHFKIGYSYDATFSKLSNVESGTHEIVLGFDFNLFQSQVLSPRFF